jgi:AcrR family transcriptional regulator
MGTHDHSSPFQETSMATTTDGSKTSRKGPTRSEESKAAILEATRVEMAETGWRGFSVDSVAKRASASKQTIYRWWPSIGAMCVDAALALIPDSPDGGRDPQERITALIVPLEATARTGQGHAVLRVALLAAVDDKEAGEVWRAWIGRDIRQPLRMLLAELAGKKVIRRDFDLDEVLELLLGPLWHRLMIMRAPVREGFCAEQAGNFLRVYATF